MTNKNDKNVDNAELGRTPAHHESRGANGARVRLAPPEGLEKVKSNFDRAASGTKKISMTDRIVLGGAAAVEKAAKAGGHDVTVPFTPGRMDATDARTDAESFDYLQPVSDGFRNFHNTEVGFNVPPEHLFLDRAALLSLSAPEWTALTGGLRVLDQNYKR